jgi:hypothetical protein
VEIDLGRQNWFTLHFNHLRLAHESTFQMIQAFWKSGSPVLTGLIIQEQACSPMHFFQSWRGLFIYLF